MGNGLKIKMLIKNRPRLIRCLPGRGPEEKRILFFSHFGNMVSVVMKLVHRRVGEALSLTLKTFSSKLISRRK